MLSRVIAVARRAVTTTSRPATRAPTLIPASAANSLQSRAPGGTWRPGFMAAALFGGLGAAAAAATGVAGDSDVPPDPLARWRDTWASGVVNFHRAEPNEHLVANAEMLLGAGRHRILVPLCGKSQDLVWLAERGHAVTGVEGVVEAVLEFSAENPALGMHLKRGALTDDSPIDAATVMPVYAAAALPELEIVMGDFFDVTPNVTNGTFARAWDRASLVAVTPAERAAYLNALCRLLSPGAAVLLVTMEYDQAKRVGSPYSISPSDVRRLFEPRGFTVVLLGTKDLSRAPQYGRFRDAGIASLVEHVFLLTYDS